MHEQTLAFQLFRQGRLSEATKAIDPGTDDPALALELAYLLGRASHVRTEAKRLILSKASGKATKAKALRILGNQLRDDGAFEDALHRFRAALADLPSGGDPLEVATAHCSLLEAECDATSFDASRPTALHTRRVALRSGDPAVLALTHHTFGRLEARVGDFDRALRHFAMARRSLEECSNAYIGAAVNLDESSTRSLLGEFPEALDLASAAFEAALGVGWSKGVVAAAANCAFLCVVLGRLREAEQHLALADKQAFSSPSYALAVLETRAQIALAEHDYGKAEQLLATRNEFGQTAGNWYALSAAETEIRVLGRQGRWLEAARRADSALKVAIKHDVRPFLISLRLRRALAIAASGGKVQSRDIPTNADWSDWSLSSLGNFWLVRAMVSSASDHASTYARRALTIFTAIGDRSSEFDAQQIAAAVTQPPRANGLDSAVALMDVAGHPQILAREAFALIEGPAASTRSHWSPAARRRSACSKPAAGTSARHCSAAARRPATRRSTAAPIATRPSRSSRGPKSDSSAGAPGSRSGSWSHRADPRPLPPRREAARRAVAGRVARRRSRHASGSRSRSPKSSASPGASARRRSRCCSPARPAPARRCSRKTIHQASDRADKTLLAFNCTAVPARHAREPAVRLPQGRLHRRRHLVRRRHPRRRRRHAVPRRDRRHAARPAAQAAALPRDPRDPPARRAAARSRSTSA